MLHMTYPPMAQHQVLVPLPPATERASPRPVQRSSQPSQRAVAFASDPRAHRQATRIAASWRGFSLRRSLRARQITMTFLQKKAIVIQCFMRRFFAKQKTALKRSQREELVHHEQIAWQTAKLNEFKGSVNWERAAFDDAAVKVQRVLRWFFARKRGAATLADCPIQPQHAGDGRTRSYMPAGWRRHRTTRPSLAPASPISNSNNHSLKELARAKGGSPAEKSWMLAPPRSHQLAIQGDTASTPSRPLLAAPSGQLVTTVQSPYSRKYRCPPGQLEVETINKQMRLRLAESERAAHSEQNEQRQRRRWEGIIEQDLETCAAVLQRRFRKSLAQQELHTRQCLKTYLDRNATTIQCAFRCFVAKRRTAKLRSDITGDIWLATRKYGIAQVERIKAEFVWNAFLMIRAATIIQVAFRRFRYLRAFPTARSGSQHIRFEEYAARGPRGLPTGLLQGFPQTIKATVTNALTEGRKKPVLRRHKNPAARRALADLRKREQQPKARPNKSSADTDSSKRDLGATGSPAAGPSRADEVAEPSAAADTVEDAAVAA